MRNRWMCLWALLCLWPVVGMGQTAATLPPQASTSVQAPIADIQARMFTLDPRVDVVQDIAIEEQTLGLVGIQKAENKASLSALWRYDMLLGTFSLRYEAPEGYEIRSPVFCGGDLYWSQWRQNRADGWEIMVLRKATDRIESLRTDPYEQSTLAPILRTDGERIYWYESNQSAQNMGVPEQYPVQLFCASAAEAPQALLSLLLVNDGQGPAISEKILAVGRYEENPEKWTIVLFTLEDGKALETYEIHAKPFDIQLRGTYLSWIEEELPGEEMARTATWEEDEPFTMQPSQFASGGRLMLLERMSGVRHPLDVMVAAAVSLPSGIAYVRSNGMLYFYSNTLAQVLRLSPNADFLPLLDARAAEIGAVRALWTGEDTIYRPLVLDVLPLETGWPDLL